MSNFYCTNANCTARQCCANAQSPYRTDQIIIYGQGVYAADCPDLVPIQLKTADDVVAETGGIF